MSFIILVLKVLSLGCPCWSLSDLNPIMIIDSLFILWWPLFVDAVFIQRNNTIFINRCFLFEFCKAPRNLIGLNLTSSCLSLWYLFSHSSNNLDLLLCHGSFLLLWRSAYVSVAGRIYNFIVIWSIQGRWFTRFKRNYWSCIPGVALCSFPLTAAANLILFINEWFIVLSVVLVYSLLLSIFLRVMANVIILVQSLQRIYTLLLLVRRWLSQVGLVGLSGVMLLHLSGRSALMVFHVRILYSLHLLLRGSML